MRKDQAGESLKGANRSAFKQLGQTKSIRDFIGGRDQTDLYKVSLGRRSRLNLQMTRLQDNADVELFKLKRGALQRIGNKDFDSLSRKQLRRFIRPLDSSEKRGTRDEVIRGEFGKGTYYVRVYPATAGDRTPYKLSLSARRIVSPPPPPLEFSQSWVKQIGTNGNDYSYGVAVDSTGKVYIAGSTEGLLETGGTDAGKTDAFIAQYDSDGNSQWLKQVGSSEEDVFFGIRVGENDAIYAAGGYNIAAPTPNPFFLGSGDSYLVRYNSNGDQVWAEQFNAGGIDSVGGLATQGNNIYLAGISISVFPSLSSSAYAAKYDSDQNSQSFSGDITDIASGVNSAASGIAVDGDGNIYITGVTNAALQTDPNNPVSNGDAFVAKYSSTGEQLWFETLASSEEVLDYARAIEVDAQGNVYIVGETAGSLAGNTSAGQEDAFFAKYDSSGNRQWVKQFGTNTLDQAQGLTLDSAGNIYLVGESNAALFGDHAGGSDTWLARYDSNGNLLSQTQFGTASDDEGYSVAVSSTGEVYVTGQTQGILETGGTQSGNYDVWLAKYTLV